MQSRVPAEVYESYHDIATKHSRQELNIKYIQGHLFELFKNYKEIIEILPNFFSDLPVSKPVIQSVAESNITK